MSEIIIYTKPIIDSYGDASGEEILTNSQFIGVELPENVETMIGQKVEFLTEYFEKCDPRHSACDYGRIDFDNAIDVFLRHEAYFTVVYEMDSFANAKSHASLEEFIDDKRNTRGFVEMMKLVMTQHPEDFREIARKSHLPGFNTYTVEFDEE